MSDDAADAPRSNPVGALLSRLPVIGYASRCVDEAKWGQLALLGLNLLMALALAVIWWGGAALISVAEIGALLMFLVIFAIAGGG